MLAARLPGIRKRSALERIDDGDDLRLIQHLHRFRLNERRIPFCQYVSRKRRLKDSASPEHDNGVELLFGEAKKLGKHFDVPIVLPQRVLKPKLPSEQTLRPLRIVLVSEDPALHVLGFDDEDTEAGDDHVVDLRCPVDYLYRDVIDRNICLLIKKKPLTKARTNFPEPSS